MIAHFARQRDGTATLRFTYHWALIEDLKRAVPAFGRQWNPETKTWTVAAPWAELALGLMRRHLGHVTVEEAASPPGPLRPTDRLYAALHLLPSAPAVLVDAAYRSLTKVHHPDRVPRAERERAHRIMLELNESYAMLRDRVSA